MSKIAAMEAALRARGAQLGTDTTAAYQQLIRTAAAKAGLPRPAVRRAPRP